MRKSEQFKRIEALQLNQEHQMIQDFSRQAEARRNNRVKCTFCQEEFPQFEILGHKSCCTFRPVVCQHCRQEFPSSLLRDHQVLCQGPQTQQVLPPQPARRQTQQQAQVRPLVPRGNQTNPVDAIGRFGRDFLRGVEQGFLGISNSVNRFGYTSYINRSTQVAVRIQGDVSDTVPTHERVHQRILQGNTARNQKQQQEEVMKSENVVFPFRSSANLSPSARNCPICQSEYDVGENVKMLKCTHRFHEECIDAWFRRSNLCPICKSNALN